MEDPEMSIDEIPSTDIEEGVFKYVLIKATFKGRSKLIVRGYNFAEYHDDVFQRVKSSLGALGVTCEVEGGGRIRHENKSILVYGYSVAFGRADHAEAVRILKEDYPSYKDISFSNDGY